MADLIAVLGVLVFFAIAVLFVAACDRIIGPDPTPAPVSGDDTAAGVSVGSPDDR